MSTYCFYLCKSDCLHFSNFWLNQTQQSRNQSILFSPSFLSPFLRESMSKTGWDWNTRSLRKFLIPITLILNFLIEEFSPFTVYVDIKQQSSHVLLNVTFARFLSRCRGLDFSSFLYLFCCRSPKEVVKLFILWFIWLSHSHDTFSRGYARL